ncbi:hypothetical protein JCM14467A_01040 [Vulcanisaeta sp. JCM 14467]
MSLLTPANLSFRGRGGSARAVSARRPIFSGLLVPWSSNRPGFTPTPANPTHAGRGESARALAINASKATKAMGLLITKGDFRRPGGVVRLGVSHPLQGSAQGAFITGFIPPHPANAG